MHFKPHHRLLLFVLLLSVLSIIPAAAQSGDCLPTQFSADDYYPMAIVTPGDSNNVRAEPSPSGELLGQIAAGAGMQVYTDEAPVCLNGLLWRHVQTPYIRGWAVEANADGYFIVPYQHRDPVEFTKPQDGSDWVVTAHGVTFTIPAALPFAQVNSDISTFSLFTMYAFPSHLNFDFGQHLTDGWAWPVDIAIYDYASDPDLLNDGEWLQTLVTEQPPLVATLRDQNRPPQSPMRGLSRLVAVPAYLPFGSGSGLRYITTVSGEVVILNLDQSIVVYRGLSADGAYLISMNMPVQLPASVITPDSPRHGADVAYLNALEDTLAALPTSAFTPDLALYDALFSSITITNPDELDARLP
ncbi:MAG: hypothetical protein J0M07_27400 [Anaerolineae bacterium]|nr:hypothetical protein [Anaerolineae bacterium]